MLSRAVASASCGKSHVCDARPTTVAWETLRKGRPLDEAFEARQAEVR